MTWHLTLDYETYERAREQFTWNIPDGYNIAHDCLRKHENADERTALYQAYPDGRREEYTFADLDAISNRLAHGLADLGVEREDRIGIVVPQKPENPLTHFAAWKTGAVSMPLSVLFGEDSLRYRLTDSEASVVVVDETALDTVAAVADDCPALEHVVVVDGTRTEVEADVAVHAFEEVCEGQSESYEIADTDVETPALILYTSGSTGSPKGVLHTHGIWVGHCPAFYMYFERDVRGDSVYWTPADWAWIGALGDLVFPAWHYGQPVVGYPMGSFDAEEAFELVAEFDVTNTFIPPTALRMMMDVEEPADRYDLALDAICSGGEPLTSEILDWATDELDGTVVNELYGQTEANLLVTNCRDWFEARPGSMGKPVPGHEVAVLDRDGDEECPPGHVGEIGVRRGDDPTVFEQYWRDERRTAEVTRGEWHLTGDLAEQDDEGYCWFKARDDDLIITSGYRVGPGEVEDAILEHEAIAQVGVIGVPDETRGEIIKAIVQPAPDADGTDELREDIRDLVSDKLAKYEYPREIEFVDELPQTTTGKIQRQQLRERE